MVSQLRTRRELQRLVEESQSASKAKSQFLANMSHEIRTPLHGVIGMANLLLGTNLNDRQRRYATLVKSSTEVLTTLINDILDFSKIEAGKLELESCEFNPHTVVEDVVELLSQKSFARGVEMICHISTNVPTAAKGDSTRLRQILMNLIGNAVKFTETGEIVVRANCESSADGKILVRFAISDSGIGIPQDRVDRLFKSFSQVDASTTRRFGGTGLGLAISKQLAELMGGQIGVKSERGRGSTFWFTIALEAVNAAPAENFTEFSGIRALVVDDNATSGKIICQELIDAGANAVATADTTQAIELLTAAGNAGEPFGLVILDREQPGVDVCELATQINLQFKSAPPTLLLLTTAPGEMSPQELTTAGFHGAVTKPVRRSQLITAVARIILGKSDDAPSSESFEPVAVDKSFRILLAEDNEVNQVVACEFLRNRGYTIEIACDGSAAVEAIQRENFDLVLMDCQMPVMDGFEATAAIRKLEETAAADGKSRRRVPIIALTANASNADRGRCLAAGMDAYCGKPFQPRELLDVIASFLSEDAPAIAAPESPLKSADPSTDKPVFDIGTFLERCTGNYSLVMTILEKFERQAADAIAQLETCVKDGDAKQMAKLAHGLKGTAGIVAAESLRSAVAKLEELARGDTLDDAKNCLQQVQEEMRRCSSHIPLARSQLQQSAPIG
jgi:CheY-like chemotaxis protein/nitrogen-specific signal transduction histidine kinase/HPt (histidine-containing phosphotransfer) domain-containing protein